MSDAEVCGVSGEVLTASQALFDQAVELWATPEIDRRRARGVLPTDFQLGALQVLLSPNRGNVIRLNDEVRAVARYRVEGPTKAGERIALDPDRVVGLTLPEDDDPNSAHFTMVLAGSEWLITFDFRYDRARAREHLAAANEFLVAARQALSSGFSRPACQLLLDALELSIKAELILTPCGETKSHQEWLRRFSEWTRLGNAPAASQKALSKLTTWRSAARYLERPFDISIDELEECAFATEQQIEHVKTRVDRVIEIDHQEDAARERNA